MEQSSTVNLIVPCPVGNFSQLMENNGSLTCLHETPLVLILAEIKLVHASAFFFLISISILSSLLRLLLEVPSGFPTKVHFVFTVPYVLHAPPLSPSIFNYPNKLTFDVEYKSCSFSLYISFYLVLLTYLLG